MIRVEQNENFDNRQRLETTHSFNESNLSEIEENCTISNRKSPKRKLNRRQKIYTQKFKEEWGKELKDSSWHVKTREFQIPH